MASTEDLRAPIRTPQAAAGLRRQQETAALGDAIAKLASRIQAATYELLVMIGEFDSRDEALKAIGGEESGCEYILPPGEDTMPEQQVVDTDIDDDDIPF